MKREIFTIPNLLSLSRVLLIVPFVLVMIVPGAPARWWGVGILLLATLTDKLDGMAARAMHQESELGRILDPLADKIGVAAAAVVFLYLNWLPIWFVALLLIRDLLILTGGLIVRRKTGKVLPSNLAGKWSIGVFAATLVFVLVDAPPWLQMTGIWASVTMVLVSTIGYVRRFTEVMRER